MRFEPNERPPILIAAPARCGATLVASTLYEHGVWFADSGIIKMPRKVGYYGLDNYTIARLLKQYSRTKGDRYFGYELLKLVPPHMPWGIRNGQVLIKNHLFLENFPSAIWLLPFRGMEKMVASAMNHPILSQQGEARRREVARNHRKLQKQIASQRPDHHLWVDMEKVGSGYLDEGRRMVEFCGISFDRAAFDRIVDPDMWHKEE